MLKGLIKTKMTDLIRIKGTKQFRFLVKGQCNRFTGIYRASVPGTPPKDSTVELVSGKFPITDNRDVYPNSKTEYTFRDINTNITYDVTLDGCTYDCTENSFDSNVEGQRITVFTSDEPPRWDDLAEDNGYYSEND